MGNHPALRAVEDNRHFPKHGGAPLTQTHHQHGGPIAAVRRANLPGFSGEILDLCEPLERHGAWFRPLIRESYVQIPVHRGQSFRRIADSVPVIADSF
jgi:hypothetical protein